MFESYGPGVGTNISVDVGTEYRWICSMSWVGSHTPPVLTIATIAPSRETAQTAEECGSQTSRGTAERLTKAHPGSIAASEVQRIRRLGKRRLEMRLREDDGPSIRRERGAGVGQIRSERGRRLSDRHKLHVCGRVLAGQQYALLVKSNGVDH